jgi:hypothetical protein
MGLILHARALTLNEVMLVINRNIAPTDIIPMVGVIDIEAVAIILNC